MYYTNKVMYSYTKAMYQTNQTSIGVMKQCSNAVNGFNVFVICICAMSQLNGPIKN